MKNRTPHYTREMTAFQYKTIRRQHTKVLFTNTKERKEKKLQVGDQVCFGFEKKNLFLFITDVTEVPRRGSRSLSFQSQEFDYTKS